jgi:predicted PolB exonuclease-like 3'-5' exonuclease
MAIMVFDIETIPDTVTGKLVNKVSSDFSEIDTVKIMQCINRQKKQGSEFLPHYLQKIVAISVLVQDKDNIKIWSLGDLEDVEAKLLERFFHGLDLYQPTLVSWNGSGFDLPVIHYRSLLHKVVSKTYWEVGDHRTDFKWNNYINRYHYRHMDVMDLLSGYQKGSAASLNNIAIMLGMPGKMVLTADQVLNCYLEQDLLKIRNYCEIDVLNTYLIFLRMQYIRGSIDQQEYANLQQLLTKQLTKINLPHFNEFMDSWQRS